MLFRRIAVAVPNMKWTFWTMNCKAKEMLKRLVRKNTDATQRYFRDGTPVNRAETRCMPSGGEKTHNVVRQNRLGEAHLRRHKSWKNSKFEALDSHVKYTRTSETTQSTTRLCSCEKRIQTIARRALGKDARRIHNHSSQSTNKTAKRTTSREQRRIWLRSLPENRLEVLQRVAGQPANDFVRVAGQLADSFVIFVNVDQNHWKTSKWNSQHSSSPDDWWFFLRARTGFGYLEKTSSQPTGGVNSTPLKQHVQSCTAWSHFITRTRVAQVARLRTAHLLCPVLTTLKDAYEENCAPAKYRGKEYEGWSQQSHEMRAKQGLAQSRLRVGQDWFGVVRVRGMEYPKKKVWEGRGQARHRYLVRWWVWTLSRAQAESWGMCKVEQEKEPNV